MIFCGLISVAKWMYCTPIPNDLLSYTCATGMHVQRAFAHARGIDGYERGRLLAFSVANPTL